MRFCVVLSAHRLSSHLRKLQNCDVKSRTRRCITPKRVMSWRGPSLSHCSRSTPLLSKKYRSGGEPLATLSPIWPARDLNIRPPAPEMNESTLDQLAGISKHFKITRKQRSIRILPFNLNKKSNLLTYDISHPGHFSYTGKKKQLIKLFQLHSFDKKCLSVPLYSWQDSLNSEVQSCTCTWLCL